MGLPRTRWSSQEMGEGMKRGRSSHEVEKGRRPWTHMMVGTEEE
jgi:hypothetical protein